MTKILFYTKESNTPKEIKCPKGTLVATLEGIKETITAETYNHCMKKIQEVTEEGLQEFRLLQSKSGLYSIFAVISVKDVAEAKKHNNNSDWRKTVLKDKKEALSA